MSLTETRDRREVASAPRVSGDEPFYLRLPEGVSTCSPRERG